PGFSLAIPLLLFPSIINNGRAPLLQKTLHDPRLMTTPHIDQPPPSRKRAMPIVVPTLNIDLIYKHHNKPYSYSNHYQHYLGVHDDIRVAANTSAEMFFKRHHKDKDHQQHSSAAAASSSSSSSSSSSAFPSSSSANNTNATGSNSNSNNNLNPAATSNSASNSSSSTGRHLFSTPSFFKRNVSSESMNNSIASKAGTSHNDLTATLVHTNHAPAESVSNLLTIPLPENYHGSSRSAPAPSKFAPISFNATTTTTAPPQLPSLSDDNQLRIPTTNPTFDQEELGQLFSNIGRDVSLDNVTSIPQRRSPSPPSPSSTTPHRRTPSPRPQLPPIITTPKPHSSTSSPAYFPQSRGTTSVLPSVRKLAAVNASTASLSSISSFSSSSTSNSIIVPIPTHPSTGGELSDILSPPPNTLRQQHLINALSAAFDKISDEPVARSPRSPVPRTPRTPRTPSSPHSPSSPRFLHRRSTSATGLSSQFAAADRMYAKRNSSGINLASVISAVEQQQQRATAASAIPAAVASFVTPHTNHPYPRHRRYNLPNGSSSSLSSSTSSSTAPASPTNRTPTVAVDIATNQVRHGSIFNIPEDDHLETTPTAAAAATTAAAQFDNGSPSSPSFGPRPFGSSTSSSSHSAGKIVKRPALKFSVHAPLHANPVSLAIKKATPVTPAEMAAMLGREGKRSSSRRKDPLLIDVRNLAEFQQHHVHGSFNVNLPTLLIKRYRRGSISNFSLESFITTPEGREAYLERLRGGGKGADEEGVKMDEANDGDDGDDDDNEEESIVVYDETMDESDKGSPAWTLIGVLERAVSGNLGATTEADSNAMTPHTATRVYWLKGGFDGFMGWDRASEFLGGDGKAPAVGAFEQPRAGGFEQLQLQLHPATPGQPTVPVPAAANANANGNIVRRTSLFSLDTTSTRPKRDSAQLSKQASLRAANRGQPGRPPVPVPVRQSDEPVQNLVPATNVVGASSTNSNGNPVPADRAASNTPTSALSPQTNPWGSDSSATTLSRSSTVSRSSAAGTVSTNTPVSPVPNANAPHFKSTAAGAASPVPEEQPLTTPTSCDSPRLSAGEESFSISEIIPGFIFVGPELTTKEHVQGLEERGIRRVLNMAEECMDDVPGLQQEFVYKKIAARDTVEMRNVERCLREAVEFIDEAKRNHDPIYVHCKAGKSRSVTAVLAYLISVERWTLKRAYRHVTKMRPGICPNIGFVAELMRIEDGVHGVVSSFVGPEWGGEGSMPSPELTREIERLEREWERDSSESEGEEEKKKAAKEKEGEGYLTKGAEGKVESKF
ncbi:hypothetical protein BC936DRAFT_145699, partial [Jimgerdemannia flammicorona]